MKDSKLYAQRLKRLLKDIKQTGQEPVHYEDPLEALVHGVLCEYFSNQQAQQLYRKMMRHFVDFNDLRVARTEEIMDVWSEHSPQAKHAAAGIISLLMTVFNKFHTLDLAGLKQTGKRPAKQFLQAMDGVSKFALDYCMLTCMHAHTIAINELVYQYLKAEQLVHPEAKIEDIQGFLTRLVPAKQAYAAYQLLWAKAQTWASHPKKASGKSKPGERA